MKKAVVLLSGGLDSATCVAIAQQQGFELYALSFNYSQKHIAELEAAKNLARFFQVQEHRVMDLSGLGALGGSALTDETLTVPLHQASLEIPITYVPARNTVFLSIALGFAEVIGAYDIFVGLSSVDYSGYPDCRPEYLAAFQHMANLSNKCGVEGRPIQIHAPLMALSKAKTIEIGLNLGVPYQLSVSCYQADAQGKACGVCDSCALRREGFKQAGVNDPTLYRVKL